MKTPVLLSFLIALFCAPAFASGSGQNAPPTIVVLGDSLVAGYQLGPGESYPERLQIALNERGIEATIIGAGVSGDTSTGGLARLDWSVPEGTDGVILELGANDALRGLPPEITRTNLATMIEKLTARGVDVLLAGMLAPPNMGPDYAAKFNPIYPELAAANGLLLDPFFLDGVTAVPGMTLDDRMHPNVKGVDAMVARTLPLVEQFIDRIRVSN